MSVRRNSLLATPAGSPGGQQHHQQHPQHVRPSTATPVQTNSMLGLSPQAPHPRSADRMANVQRNLGHLKETLATVASNSRDDMAAQLRGGGAARGPAQHVPLAMRPQSAVVGGGAGGAGDEWRDVKEQAARLQQHITLEVRRRTEADAGLQQAMDVRARDIRESLEQKAAARLMDVHKAVDLLTKRVDTLGAELAQEREKNVRLTQELKFQSTQGVQDVKSALGHERAQRLEKEQLLGKKLTEDVFRLQERLDVERHAREQMVGEVRSDLGRAARKREKSDVRLLLQLQDDVRAMAGALEAERDQRERGEEQLAATMDDMVGQVNQGLQALAAA